MRIGFNPNKDKAQEGNDFFHQVIIPVYIPNQEGYFKDSFQILKYCLNSLLKTSHLKTFITVVNNGSCRDVTDYLNELYNKEKIHEIIHTANIGKLNAVLKGVVGHKFDIITITDADVLFLNDWQKETYCVFNAFPKAGAISPTPSSKVIKQYTYNILFEKFFSKKLKFSEVKNREAMLSFASSIGNPDFYNETHLKSYLTVSNDNTKAVIGAGHFVTTYRGTIFNNLKNRFSNFKMGGSSEVMFLDKPVVDQGYWRLSTEDNFAYHMGNVIEPWMGERVSTLEDRSHIETEMPSLKINFSLKILRFIQARFFWKTLNKKIIWIWFLQFKGLDKINSKKY
ncbi:glycosyltransferase family A protein [Flavobacterium artemisiae]|uniref:Glycosyltransferase family A protein n=1 Tax=Flavobacterium artemisiae TaxID=2126556 RepID=A0ABW4H8L0_9FLAO